MTFATILVVADEPQIRGVIDTTLASQGYSAVEAQCGDDALLKLLHSRLDLILLDVNMSGIRGLDACLEMRCGTRVFPSCTREMPRE